MPWSSAALPRCLFIFPRHFRGILVWRRLDCAPQHAIEHLLSRVPDITGLRLSYKDTSHRSLHLTCLLPIYIHIPFNHNEPCLVHALIASHTSFIQINENVYSRFSIDTHSSTCLSDLSVHPTDPHRAPAQPALLLATRPAVSGTRHAPKPCIKHTRHAVRSTGNSPFVSSLPGGQCATQSLRECLRRDNEIKESVRVCLKGTTGRGGRAGAMKVATR